MTEQPYHMDRIRRLFLEGFDERELRLVCHDVPEFREVHHELGRNVSKAEIVDHLLEYAEKHLEIPLLLRLAKERNPARYDCHGPYSFENPGDILQETPSEQARRLADLTSPAQLTQEQQYQIALHWRKLGGTNELAYFNLARANLAGVDLSGADLHGANLMKARLPTAQLQGANLRGACLNYANLRAANLRDADLTGAELRGVKLRGADLTGACLLGADTFDTDLSLALSLEGVTMPNGKPYKDPKRRPIPGM